MRSSMFLLVFVVTTAVSQHTTFYPTSDTDCKNCPPGPKGIKGVEGVTGSPGDIGEPGDPGSVYYRGGVQQCGSGPCPTGVPGDQGDIGRPGYDGYPGKPGLPGPRGVDGEPGDVGLPGSPGTSNGDVMYLPYKPGDIAGQVCYSFRKVCLVPGLRNGWRGWYREGQSGYMIYKKWMYFVTLSKCPCQYNEPRVPQPAKPTDCVRLGECQSLD